MKASEARKLIGKRVKYRKIDRYSQYIGDWREVLILQVDGRNLEVDFYGMTDWLWLPEIQVVPLDNEQEKP
jgi:hypothetical protein